MTTQILTSANAYGKYVLPEAERLALLPLPRKPGEPKPKLKLSLTKQEIKQVLKDVSRFVENDGQPIVNQRSFK